MRAKAVELRYKGVIRKTVNSRRKFSGASRTDGEDIAGGIDNDVLGVYVSEWRRSTPAWVRPNPATCQRRLVLVNRLTAYGAQESRYEDCDAASGGARGSSLAAGEAGDASPCGSRG